MLNERPTWLGEDVGWRCVQFTPSHTHVSLKSVPAKSSPPNSTTTLRRRSYAIAWPPRGGGLVAGKSWVQALPSHDQVSPGGMLAAGPPNKMVRPVPPWCAIATKSRFDGPVVASCVHVLPFQAQVSFNAVPMAVLPPNISTTPRVASLVIAW